MKITLSILLLALLTSCSTTNIAGKTKVQKDTYKNWVLSRCLSKAFPSEPLKQDALNSASSYLEISTLPLDAFTGADQLIDSFLLRNHQGSIPGTFNAKKCIDLFNSDELENIYKKQNK
jgi:hypothetical protein